MHYDSRNSDKAVNRCFFVFDSIPDQYKTQEICDNVVSEGPSLIVYCLEKCVMKLLMID